MAWDSCRQEVERTGDKMCDVNLCAKVQAGVDHRCHDAGWAAGHPFGIYSPDGKLCFCCCSCYAWGTPIEAQPGEFREIEAFVPGDPVLASGPDLVWSSVPVLRSTGMVPVAIEQPMCMVRYNLPNDPNTQQILVTEDHVFLMHDRSLRQAILLQAGENLTTPAGEAVAIVDVIPGMHKTGVQNISTGPLVDGSLKNHFINSNGVVTADMEITISVQAGHVDDALFTSGYERLPRAGTEEYLAKCSPATAEFLASPQLWPEGFRPKIPNCPLFNIPVGAYSLLTEDEARQIERARVDRRPFDSSIGVSKVRYVFDQLGAFFPKPKLLLDWGNRTPNVYAFTSYDQDFIIITGGLARLFLFSNEGFAIVLCQSIARMYGGPPPSFEFRCVGPADYGAADKLQTVFRDNYFGEVVGPALDQVEELFSLLEEPECKVDKCLNPTPKCRIATFRAGASLMPLPICADPTSEFVVRSASPIEKGVEVLFSHAVDVATAETVSNYTLEPEAKIKSAEADQIFGDSVLLKVKLEEDTEYTLTVDGVQASDGTELAPDGHIVEFKTGVAV